MWFLFKQLYRLQILLLVSLGIVGGIDLFSKMQSNLAMLRLTNLIQTTMSSPSAVQPFFQLDQLDQSLGWLAQLPPEHLTNMDFTWDQSNPSRKDLAIFFFASADQALHSKLYWKAYTYYLTGQRYLDLRQFDHYFKIAIAALLSGHQDTLYWLHAAQELDSSFRIYTLQDRLKIEGGDLRQMLPISNFMPGMSISSAESSNNSGILWTNGEAVAVIWVAETGHYSLRFPLRNRGTPTLVAEFGIDKQTIRQIYLSLKDNSWETFETTVHLTRGFHLFNISFLNDVFTETESRDLEIEWVELQKIE